MSNTRQLRQAVAAICTQYRKQIGDASQIKLLMPNTHGMPQHRVINPVRQAKKMLKREMRQ